MQHSVSELLVTIYRECKISTKRLMAESPWMHREILSTLLSGAMGEEKLGEATRIKETLRNESQKKVWASIHMELN